jgi:hypothetical protein
MLVEPACKRHLSHYIADEHPDGWPTLKFLFQSGVSNAMLQSIIAA